MTIATPFRQDLGYAARSLRKNPGFVLLTAAIVGLGVGALTAAFSVVKPLLVAPLPFENPGALVWIQNEAGPGENSLSAVTSRTSNLIDFRERARSFEAITGYNAFSEQSVYTLTGIGEPEPLRGFGVAHDFLDVLGIEAAVGRGFTLAEGRWDGPDAVILDHGFWQRRFAGDPGVVGTSLTLNGTPHEVVGVLPPDFDFASIFRPGARVDLLVTWPIAPETDRWGNSSFFIGRLRDGTTPDAAQAELDAIVTALQEDQPDRWGLGAEVRPLQSHVAAPFRSSMLMLLGAAGAVLLIVCVNVSNMLLARVPGRSREMAVRTAFGASRGRMIRQLLLESTGTAFLGALIGAGLAWIVVGFVAGSNGIQVPLLDQVRVDASALGVAAAAALLTGLVVGLVPALHVAGGGEAGILRSGGRGHTGSRGSRRLRESLVVAELALACVLLVAGGLLLRSFQAVLDVELGFEPARTVAWQLNPSRSFESLGETANFFRLAADRVAEVPGVEAVGLTDALPLGRNRTWGFQVVGGDPDLSQVTGGIYPHLVDPGYLPSMDIEVREGRNLASWDTGESAPVVLMNASGAAALFPEGGALGQRILTGGGQEWEIVGIVEDVRHLSPELDPGVQVYFPITQLWDYGTLDLLIRTSVPEDVIAPRVAEALQEVDPAMPVRDHWTLEGQLREVNSSRRFILQVLVAFAGVALILAALGIYGVLAVSVAERGPEISIRMALGASGPEVVKRVLGRTVILAAVGIVIGTVVSLGLSDLLRSLLFGVEATDWVTFGGIWFLLLGVAVFAAAVPATRAARMRGIRALRAE
jgi:predicted permease